jgi:SAM-dependent methyltransferase
MLGFDSIFAMFRHYERGDMLQDPAVPFLARRNALIRYELASFLAKDKDVLDVGCGNGYGSYMLARKAHYVIGIDKDEKAVAYAKARYKCQNLEFDQAGATEYLSRTDRKFDLVVMLEVIEHIVEKQTLLKMVRDSLKVNGLLILTTPNKRFTPFYRRNPYHAQELSFEGLVELLQRDFSIEKCMGQVPGQLALVPLPYYFLLRIVHLVPCSSNMFQFNNVPGASRNIVVLARPRTP